MKKLKELIQLYNEARSQVEMKINEMRSMLSTNEAADTTTVEAEIAKFTEQRDVLKKQIDLLRDLEDHPILENPQEQRASDSTAAHIPDQKQLDKMVTRENPVVDPTPLIRGAETEDQKYEKECRALVNYLQNKPQEAELRDITTTTNGGNFIIPKIVASKVFEVASKYSFFRNRCNIAKVPLGVGNTVNLGVATDLSASVKNEAQKVHSHDGKAINGVSITLRSIGSSIEVSNDLITGTPIDIVSYLIRQLARAIFREEEKLHMATVLAAIGNNKTLTAAAQTEFTYQELSDFVYLITHKVNAGTSYIVMSKDAEAKLLGLEDTSKRPLAQPFTQLKQIFGYSVDYSSELGTVTQGKTPMILVDTEGLGFVESSQGMNLNVDRTSKAMHERGLVGISIYMASGIGLIDPETAAALKMKA